jgi:hypothetical protein
MSNTIPQKRFSDELFLIFEETFEAHHGIYLDKNTSLFDTLDLISAKEASIPVGNGCATIAAQVEHVIYYLEVLGESIAGREIGDLDWDEIWNRVSSGNEGEWEEIKTRLRTTYQQLREMLRSIKDWDQNDAIGDSIAIVVHTAYHLGEIRQALCFIK